MTAMRLAALWAAVMSFGCTPEPAPACFEAGTRCSRHVDCCGWRADAGWCLEQVCQDACTRGTDCASGCCKQAPAPTVAGYVICQPATSCP